jgi:mRNA interferase MazF
MKAKIEASISLPRTVYEQVEKLAQELDIPVSQLLEMVATEFVHNHPKREQPRASGNDASRLINQGDIFWVQLEQSSESAAGIAHPYVVIQENLFNHSRIHTVVACALTSNIQRESNTPGNVLLDAGEADLPKQSVVEVSKITTIPKVMLGQYIGSVSAQRVNEILAGLRFLQLSFFTR